MARRFYGHIGPNLLTSSAKIHTTSWSSIANNMIRPKANVGYFKNHRTYHNAFHTATHMDPI